MTQRALAGLAEEQIKIPAPILGDSQALVTPAPGNLKSFSTIKIYEWQEKYMKSEKDMFYITLVIKKKKMAKVN